MADPENQERPETPKRFNVNIIIAVLLMAALLFGYVALDKQKTIEDLQEDNLSLLNSIDSQNIEIQGKDIILRKLGVQENIDSSSDGINTLKNSHHFYYTTAIPQTVWDAAEAFKAEVEGE